jgi:indolepyruvate ferredoxin oxidoreductase
LTPARLATLTQLAAIPDMIRGYGHVKEQTMAKAAAERERLAAAFNSDAFAMAAE